MLSLQGSKENWVNKYYARHKEADLFLYLGRPLFCWDFADSYYVCVLTIIDIYGIMIYNCIFIYIKQKRIKTAQYAPGLSGLP